MVGSSGNSDDVAKFSDQDRLGLVPHLAVSELAVPSRTPSDDVARPAEHRQQQSAGSSGAVPQSCSFIKLSTTKSSRVGVVLFVF